MLPGAGNEKFRVRGRVRSKNENDSGGPSERKPRPRRGSFLLARNRSSIVLVLVLVSAIGCKGEDVGVPKSNKLALMGLNPGLSPIALSGHGPWEPRSTRRHADTFPFSVFRRLRRKDLPCRKRV